VAPYQIRLFGDPVLRQRAVEIDDIDATLVKLADDMIQTMYDAPGVGLAAPQVGVQRRMFVYDIGDGPGVVVNPEILESSGEWVYQEGCLSIPGLSWELVRPKLVHLRGVDLDGNEIDVEADELLARCFQHEMDHLDGVLIIERLEDSDRREAMRVLRNRALDFSAIA
jgi:peptide deformylase